MFSHSMLLLTQRNGSFLLMVKMTHLNILSVVHVFVSARVYVECGNQDNLDLVLSFHSGFWGLNSVSAWMPGTLIC